MKKSWLILLGLIPTILVFIFANPWLGLGIGIITFLILYFIWWLWKINVISLVSYFSELFNIQEKELIAETLTKAYYNHLKNTVRKNLWGGKRK